MSVFQNTRSTNQETTNQSVASVVFAQSDHLLAGRQVVAGTHSTVV